MNLPPSTTEETFNGLLLCILSTTAEKYKSRHGKIMAMKTFLNESNAKGFFLEASEQEFNRYMNKILDSVGMKPIEGDGK